MRNSFADVKRYLAEQDAQIIDIPENRQGGTDSIFDRTPLRLGAPSPNASGNPKNDDERRQDVFKRALRGLGTNSPGDLAKIEDHLAQLLEEVEVIKSEGRAIGGGVKGDTDNANMWQPPVVSSHSSLDGSGWNKMPDSPRLSHSPAISYSIPDDTPPTSPIIQEEPPLPPPPRIPYSISDDASSITSTDEIAPRPKGKKSEKHRSGSSSFFPKISRWSKTNASTGSALRADGVNLSPMPVPKISYPTPDSVPAPFSEKTSYQIPDDGSPVIISTRRKKNQAGDDNGKSQTSLLIEYFEGEECRKPDAPSRPSVRVKVTPSSHKKPGKDVKIMERPAARVPSYTRRITPTKPTGTTSCDLPETKDLGEQLDNPMASYRDATVSSRGEGWD